MTWAGRRGSRWWNRRTCNLSLLTSASRIHLQMEQFSQSTCWTLVKDFGHLKEQETCPYNQVGWKNKGRKKRSQKRDWQPWWEAEGERKSPHSDKFPHGGEISWEERETSRGSKEKTMDGLSKRRQSENCVHGLCCSPAHPSLGCESYMLQSRVWNADPGRGTDSL